MKFTSFEFIKINNKMKAAHQKTVQCFREPNVVLCVRFYLVCSLFSSVIFCVFFFPIRVFLLTLCDCSFDAATFATASDGVVCFQSICLLRVCIEKCVYVQRLCWRVDCLLWLSLCFLFLLRSDDSNGFECTRRNIRNIKFSMSNLLLFFSL